MEGQFPATGVYPLGALGRARSIRDANVRSTSAFPLASRGVSAIANDGG